MNNTVPVNMRSYKHIPNKQSFLDTYNAYRDIRVDAAKKCGTDTRGYACGDLPEELKRHITFKYYGNTVELELHQREQLVSGEYCNDLYSHPDCQDAFKQLSFRRDAFQRMLKSRTAQFQKFDACVKDYLRCNPKEDQSLRAYWFERLSMSAIGCLYDKVFDRLKTFDNEGHANYKLAYIVKRRTSEIQKTMSWGGKTLQQLSSRFKKTIFNATRDQEPLTLQDINNFASKTLMLPECKIFFEYLLALYDNNETKLFEDAKCGNIHQEALVYHFLAHCQKQNLHINSGAYGSIANIAKYLIGITPRDDERDVKMVDEISSHDIIEVIGDFVVSGTITIKAKSDSSEGFDN